MKCFAMLDVDIPSLAVESWRRLTAEHLRPLHSALRVEVMQASYLQVG
jgi:hypothetical protein